MVAPAEVTGERFDATRGVEDEPLGGLLQASLRSKAIVNIKDEGPNRKGLGPTCIVRIPHVSHADWKNAAGRAESL
jgi:hypothetical protein